jgi:cytochrome c oxidase subunit 1
MNGHGHAHAHGFWRRYVFSTDHKVIARQFLWAGLLFLLLGGFLAMLIRWQWAYPETLNRLLNPQTYTKIFTLHGLVMIFFAVTPILIGAVGNFVIPLSIGARDMAFPFLNLLSFWTFAVSQLLVLASFLVTLGTAGSGWTTYPPLSTNVGAPGAGQTLIVAAIFITGIATLMGAINYITTVMRHRAPGMTWFRLPATVWGLWLTSILNLLFVPVLGAAAMLLLLDRMLGTQFFIAGAAAVKGGGDPLLYQHLFWIFGHPEVYILILPAWGVVTDLVAFFSRKPAFWYRGSIGAMIAVTVMSGVVYGHHMYASGLNPMLGKGFMLLTLIISVPAEVLFVNWLLTLWGGRARLTAPMLYTLGVMLVFAMGGLTGLLLATIGTDIYLHDTMFVVGHFHLTMAAASFLASFAALTFWFPKMFGRQMHEGLGRAHAVLTTILMILVFTGQLVAGYAGQPRRYFNPYEHEFLQHLRGLNKATSHTAFLLAGVQLLFIINFIRSLGWGQPAKPNPWQVGTLEWTCAPSPPPEHNFDTIPQVVRGPHQLSDPDVRRRLGRDYIGQAEPDPMLGSSMRVRAL